MFTAGIYMRKSILALLTGLIVGGILDFVYTGIFAIIAVISIMGAFLIDQYESYY